MRLGSLLVCGVGGGGYEARLIAGVWGVWGGGLGSLLVGGAVWCEGLGSLLVGGVGG